MKNDPSHSPSSPIETEITALAFTGKGIARIQNKVCFVDDVFPGDRVQIVITKDKGNFFEGRCTRIVSPSEHRVTPVCQHSASCGGCRWMALHYDEQIAWKARFIKDSLERIGGLLACPGEISVVSSNKTLGYRNRIQLKCEIPRKGGEFRIGYFAPASHDLVPITSCCIADDMISRYLRDLPRAKLSVLAPMRFCVEIATVKRSATEDGDALMVSIYDESRAEDKLKQLLGAHDDVVWCGAKKDISGAPFFATNDLADPRLFTKPLLFQQVNDGQNQRLKNHIRTLVDLMDPRHVLDLCCGNGNLSLALADGQRSVTGVESNREASACARHAVSFNQIKEASYFCGDALPFLDRCLADRRRFELCIIDPPRAGLGSEMDRILNLLPQNILYVSCNPSTLARDLKQIAQRYELLQVQGFDFFPHTYHVETLVHLRLK